MGLTVSMRDNGNDGILVQKWLIFFDDVATG